MPASMRKAITINGLARTLAQDLPVVLATVPRNPGIVDTEMLRTCPGSDASSVLDLRRRAESAVSCLIWLGPDGHDKSLKSFRDGCLGAHLVAQAAGEHHRRVYL